MGPAHARAPLARREGRPAHRDGRRLDVSGDRHATRSTRSRRASAICTWAAAPCSAAPSRRRTCCSNPHYGTTTLGQPLAAASLAQPAAGAVGGSAAEHRRLRGRRRVPHCRARRCFPARWRSAPPATSSSRTRPRASPRSRRARSASHVDFSPVADVNNNPRNPVINMRSFGERPDAVGRHGRPPTCAACTRAACSRRSSTFPGTATPTSIRTSGLPIISKPRARARRDRAAAVSRGHRRRRRRRDDRRTSSCPRSTAAPSVPATLSAPIVTGLLRGELGFDGLVYTDSMDMAAVAHALPPGDAAVRAVEAGSDLVVKSPDEPAAVAAIKAAVERGEIPMARLDASVRRILTAKARLGLRPDEARRRSTACPTSSVAARTRPWPSRRVSASITLDQGRARRRATARSPRRRNSVSVGARLSVGLAHRGAEPDVHSRAARAVAARDGRRGVGSDDAGRARSRPRERRRATTRSSSACSSARHQAAGAWIWRRRWRRFSTRSGAPPRRPRSRWSPCSSAIRTSRWVCRTCRRCC